MKKIINKGKIHTLDKLLNVDKDEIVEFTYKYHADYGEVIIIKDKLGRVDTKKIQKFKEGEILTDHHSFDISLIDESFLVEEKILYLYKNKRKTQKEISDIIGLSQSRVSAILSKHGFRHKLLIKKGK